MLENQIPTVRTKTFPFIYKGDDVKLSSCVQNGRSEYYVHSTIVANKSASIVSIVKTYVASIKKLTFKFTNLLEIYK